MSVILPRKFSPIPPCNNYVSSYTYSGKSKLDLSIQSITIDWSPDGQFMWVGLINGRTELSLTGATNWDVTGRTSPINYRYGFIPEIVSGGSVWSGIINTAPDGTPGGQMLLCLAFGTAICEIAQYTMPIPFNLRQGNHPDNPQGPPYYPTYQPVYVGSYDTTIDTSADSINDLRMSPDGTRIIAAISGAGGVDVIQWNLTTPYDVLGGMSYQTPVNINLYNFNALYVPPSGGCVYLGTNSGVIGQFAMSSPWEISTINTTPVSTLDVSNELSGAVASVFVTENDLYALDFGNGDIYQYSI